MPEFDSRTAMAISKTTPKRSPQASATDLKQKTISCLNKLSDRDTFKIASSELETIAQTLTPDFFSPFLACIYDTDSSHKLPARKQCVRLFQTLALAHEDALSPFVPKILQNILRRLRDPDSAVRSACVEAISAVAARVTKPPFSVFLRPFTEAILTEQDCNSQSGAAMCLSAAIDSAPDVDPAQLQRILPKFMKLLRCESFRAKPALISLIGSVAGVGGAKSGSLLGGLVPCLVEFLSSEDWAARKAASEALLKVAVAERDLVGEFKDSCLVTFESRQYDKVKSVRDSMKQMIVAWKEVPDVSCNGVSLPEQSRSSSAENASDGLFPNASKTSSTLRSDSPLKSRKRLPISRFSPPGNEQKSCPPLFCKLDRKKSPNWKFEVAIPRNSPYTVIREENAENGKGGDGKVLDQKDNKLQARSDVKRSLFDKNSEEKTSRFGRLRSQARVVPFHEKESSESTVGVSNVEAESCESHKDGGDDLSLIRKQLVQIENQQSSLLNLLQKFIGTSQNGMRSLETRVHSLELALDEISHDLALSTTRMTNSNTAANGCCKLPGAEFLSSKFWRRTETERYSNSRFSTSVATPLVDESYKLESRSYRPHGAFVVNPLAEMHSQSRGNSEISLNRPLMSGINHQSGVRQAYGSNRFLEVSPVS